MGSGGARPVLSLRFRAAKSLIIEGLVSWIARGKMARGWESKAVEDQINAAEERARRKQAAQDEISPQERSRRERLESLQLSRARTLTQLEQATRPAHRQMLQRTLRALEAEIDSLS
jgi:hypothetical protein